MISLQNFTDFDDQGERNVIAAPDSIRRQSRSSFNPSIDVIALFSNSEYSELVRDDKG